MWPKFEAIYRLRDMGIRNLLIRSNNGAGKSTLLASLIVHEFENHEEIAMICTAASATQLRQTLWRAVKRFAKKRDPELKGFTAEAWEQGHRRVLAISPSKIESGQGFHAATVGVIIDEATGMDSEKIAALMSNATGADTFVIFTYNPVNPDAAVYELEQKAKPYELLLDEDGNLDEEKVRESALQNDWISIGISAFDHPNVISGHEEIQGAVTRDFIEKILRIESVQCDHLYPKAIHLPWNGTSWLPTAEALSRVCGEWSEAVTTGFISGAVVVGSWKVAPATGLKIAGADIGGGEDPSVWTHFAGNQQMDFQQLKTAELGIVTAEIDKYCRDNAIDCIGIDDTGVGHGVTDRLNELKPPYIVVPINFASSPKNFPEVAIQKPANARCEMYLLLEKGMRTERIKILYDKELQRELCVQKTMCHAQSGLLRIEDKSLIRKRLGRSPNKADATAIALYAGRLLQYYNRPRIY